MKEGEACSLPELLAQHPEFNMTAQELNGLLDPADYIGRCPQQIDAFLARIRSLLEDIPTGQVELSL